MQSVAADLKPLSMQLPEPLQVSWFLHCEPATPQDVPEVAKFVWQTPPAPHVSAALQVVAVGSPHALLVEITVAAVVPAIDGHPPTVAVTLYVPVAAVVALAIDGFWALEVNPLGPVQL